MALFAIACAPAPEVGTAEVGMTKVADAGDSRLTVGKSDPKGSIYGTYLAGRFAERQKDLASASALMLRVLEENPEDERLRERTFKLTLQAGQIQIAVKLARELDKAAVQVSSATLLLAAIDIKAGRYEEAKKRLDAAPDIGLAKFAVPLAMAWINVGLKDNEAGLAALDALNKENGFTILRKLHSGLINDFAGNAAKAEEIYRSVKEKLSEAPLRIVRAAGVLFERTGRKAEAKALYDAYLEANPTSLLMRHEQKRLARGGKAVPIVANPTEGVAEALYNLGSALPRDRGRAGGVALLYARIALVLRPDFPLIQVLIGDILTGNQRHAEAVETYRGIDSRSPYSWVARLRVADGLYELGKIPEAERLLEKMAAEQTKRSDSLIKLGNFRRYKEKYKAAVEAYDKALVRLVEPRKQDWAVYYYRGIAHERLKQWDSAERDFLKALELSPEQPYVLNYLGYSWVDQGKNLDRARKMIERAVEQKQRDGYIVDSMGWVLYRLGEYDDAVKQLERAVQLRPQDPIISDHLGDAYWRVGRRHEARFQWHRALSLEPEKSEIEKIEAKIERGPGKAEIVGSGG